MLRWPIANLFTFFDFNWWWISYVLPPKFWFSDYFLNYEFWEADVSASFGLTVTDEVKFKPWKLSVNCHKLLILLTKFMASFPNPLSMRCKHFLLRYSLPVLLLSTISRLREFKWSFKFSTVRDTLPSSWRFLGWGFCLAQPERICSLNYLCQHVKQLYQGISVIKVVGSDAYLQLMPQ